METKFYWSPKPGLFVNKMTGESLKTILPEGMPMPQFTGDQQEWNEFAMETLIDLRNSLHREAQRNSTLVVFHADSALYEVISGSILFKPSSSGGTLAGINIRKDPTLKNGESTLEYHFKCDDGEEKMLTGRLEVVN